MIKAIYLQTWEVFKKIPVKLWGISLLAGLLTIIASIFGGIPIISLALSAAVSAGMVAVYYTVYRGGEAETNTLFIAFKDWKTFKRIAGGVCWMDLWLLLWFLIPIAGPFIAIYKSFQYAFTPYILTQEPTVSGRQALKKSIEDTKGYKGNMFLALYIPAIAFVIASGILSALGLIPYAGVLFMIINVIIIIAWYLFAPLFLGLVAAGFYDYGKKPAYVAPTPAPVIAAPAAQAETATEDASTTEAAAPEQTTTCPTCGSENSADKKFCGHCGAKLD